MKQEKFERARYLFGQITLLERGITDTKGADAAFMVSAMMVTAEQYKLMRTQYIALLSTQQADLKKEFETL